MTQKRIEIIDVKLDINLASEIKSKVDSLSTDTINHAKEIIEKNMKVQRSTKKQQALDAKEKLTKSIYEALEIAYATPGYWLEGDDLLEIANMNKTPQNLNRIMLMLRNVLKKDGKWAIVKKHSMGKSLYRLSKLE